MERFSYTPSEGYIPFERRALIEHIEATKQQPVIGVILQPNEYDIVAFAGINCGMSLGRTDQYDTYDPKSDRMHTRDVAEFAPIAGYEEIKSYLEQKIIGWRADPSAAQLNLVLSLLTSAKAIECLPESIDYEREIGDLWTAIIHLSHSEDPQDLFDLAITVQASELAPLFREHIAGQLRDASSLFATTPMVRAYIESGQLADMGIYGEIQVINSLLADHPLEK